MKRWFVMILSAGLVVLLAVLFTLSCALNRKQYQANLQFIKADMTDTLGRETTALRERIQAKDLEIFALFNRPDLSFDTCLAHRLFTIREGQAFPAGLPDVIPQNNPDPATARKAMALGQEMIKNGRQDKAREYFEAADHITALTPADLDLRIAAAMKVLQLTEYRDLKSLFNVLYSLFDYPGTRPSAEQVKSAGETLRAKVKDYEDLKKQSHELWQIASELSTAASNHPAPFRIVTGNSVLSVNLAGQAFLSPLPMKDGQAGTSLMRIGTNAPGAKAAVSREIHTIPVFVWIPIEHFEARKQAVEHAYWLTNIMLGILLSVIACMALGIGIILKRQHEVTLLRSSFVSSVSHELRTPMALIRLYAESLAADNAPAGARERYTRAIMSETDRLSALVNNVLDFSRLERGTLTLNIRATDVSAVVGEVLDSFAFRIEKEKIELTRRIAPGLIAMADPLALTQVIFNLVDNAIKYSGDNRKIEIEMASTGRNILLHIKDKGIGIPDALKPKIFSPFIRGDDSRVTSQRGSGIGLNVVRQLLERMSCSIRVFDNIQAGTVFEVTLPAEESQQSHIASTPK